MRNKPTLSFFSRQQLINHKWKVTAGLLASCMIATSLLAADFNTSPSATPGVKLNQYTLISAPIPLTGITDNASGLTFNTNSGTLFAVINNPEKLIELNIHGKVLRTIKLEGFEDTEGLAYLGDNQFAILEERKRAIVLISVTADTRTLSRHNQQSLSLPSLSTIPHTKKPNNNGFEGITIDSKTGRIFIVNEKSPRQLVQVDGFNANMTNISVSIPLDLENFPMGNKDFSGIHHDQHHDRLILVSDESKQLVEIDINGQIGSRMTLKAGNAGLTHSVPQAEGITFDQEGTLYVLSEPNLLYKFHFRG